MYKTFKALFSLQIKVRKLFIFFEFVKKIVSLHNFS